MIMVLILWSYITIISLVIGFFTLQLINKFLSVHTSFSVIHYIVAGTVFLTVYAQIISLFSGISFLAHLIMLIFTIGCAVFMRKDLLQLIRKHKLLSLENFVYLGIILVCAFFASRGNEHYDTGLYHAQAIHWLEDYGVIKGLGNLFGNYAYNSSWLPYTTLFSMKFLGGQSFHTTNGFLMALMCIYALKGLWDFRKHKSHEADMMRFGILFYAVIICVVAQSPSTDLPAMFFTLYIILRWCENTVEGDKSVPIYSLQCILIVYTVTLKLSAALLVLLVIAPAVMLIRKKEVRAIGTYISLGVLVLLPFLIRNIILSGWLLYPFEAIDLFNFEWKIPVENVALDSAYIKVYGRKTLEPDLINQSILKWFPVWWDNSENYDRLLLLSQIIGLFVMAISFIKQIVRKEKIEWNIELLNLTLFVCLLSWLFTAPFIRYGLGFMLAIPLLAIGEYHESKRISLYKVTAMSCIVLIVTCLAPYWNNYVLDSLLFVKNNASEGYYVFPKPYEAKEVTSLEVNGITFYEPYSTDQLGYDAFPGIGRGKKFEFLGDDIKDGFKTADELN